MNRIRKPVFWVGSSRADLKAFPDDVKDLMGFALDLAQQGLKHVSATPLQGFGGAAVLEIKVNSAGSTYRSVYTIKFREALYVLSAFQKKSKSGISTPKFEIDLIRARLNRAEVHYEECNKEKEKIKYGK